MDFQKRILPARGRIHHPGLPEISPEDQAGIDMVLNLMSAGDIIRHGIYSDLERHGISEGKFSLLVNLSHAGALSVQEAARRMGVAAATVSVMVRRMLAAREPLIAARPDPDDGRGRLLELTDVGRRLLSDVFPQHIEAVRRFAMLYNNLERDTLVALLERITKD